MAKFLVPSLFISFLVCVAVEGLKVDDSCNGTAPTNNCPTNADCSANKCKCKAGYTKKPDNTNCFHPIDEKCATPADCPDHANCAGQPNKTCSCPKPLVVKPDKLACLSSVNGTCNVDIDCIANAKCSSQKCQCEPNFVQNKDGTKCNDAIGTTASLILLTIAIMTSHFV